MGQVVQEEDSASHEEREADRPVPGLLFLFHGHQPMLRAVPVSEEGLIIGRRMFGEDCADERMSLHHAWVRYEGGRFTVDDLDSLNGTAVNLVRVEERSAFKPPAVLRTGHTICVMLPDIRRFQGAKVESYQYDGREISVGPTLAAVWAKVEEAAQNGDSLLVLGEKGTGKALTARTFHLAARARGQLVLASCARLPQSLEPAHLVERRLFSDSLHDTDGVLAAADGGTLYLDEIAELGPTAQEKLLRTITLGSLWPSGASTARSTDVRVVASTQRYLPSEVTAGRFRYDLYVRIAHPQVELPPMRHRFDDLAYLVTAEIRRLAPALKPHASLIEKLLVGRWPGNVEQLLAETQRAVRGAIEADQEAVRGNMLSLGARAKYAMGFPAISGSRLLQLRRGSQPALPLSATGMAADFEPGALQPRPREERVQAPPDGGAQAASLPGEESIADALRSEGGNVTRAAFTLGIHRNQLRRYLSQHPGLTLMADDDRDAN